MRLANALPPPERERLALGVMSLRAETYATGGRIPPALDALLHALVLDQPRDARARLAARMAGSRWAPPELARALAGDEAAVAQPILLRSPHLRDHDLMRVFAEGALEHQVAIARRPGLSAPTVETILQTGEPVLLTALATNERTEFSPDAMRRLVEASRKHAALRTPLARHPGLTRELAQQLAGWGCEPLKHLLAARFGLRPEAPEPVEVSEDATQQERLVDKLEKVGRLRVSYLLEALREGQLAMFVAALARLGGFTPAEIRVAIDSDGPELLALACASVGVDQQVFPTVLAGVRALNGGRPGGGDEGTRRASGAFAPFGPAVAARAFRRLAAV
ncbi:MAG TPA: DUF2336 domain-containing protein [Caulobacteraceae bacterium]|nr:DUF2336 domain-containing protein [Caulobacteraceae bacterium]